MSENSKAPSETELVDAYKSGKLINNIFDRFGFIGQADFKSILEMCVELHNAGEIDLLSLIRNSELEGIDGHRFFVGQDFFCKVIPQLRASTAEMMHCVHTLVKKGGDDLAANRPNAALKEWCETDLTRAHEIVDAAKNDDPMAVEFLTFALTAGKMAKEAKDFVRSYTDKRRLSGVSAVGRIQYATLTPAREALATLMSALENEPDDHLSANALMSAFDIMEKTDQITCDEALGVVQLVCKAPGPITQFSIARALWQYGKSLSEHVVTLLLQALGSLDPSNKGTIQEIDQGLRELLDTPYADHSIKFVAELLASSGNTLTLSDFPDFSRRLLEGPNDRFHRVFVSWMLSGERTLCDGLSQTLRQLGADEKPIDLPLKDFDLSNAEQIFLCRKAIGYLFLQPVIAGSILISVLRVCDDSVADAVHGLLFDPLLLNYGGKLWDYVSTIDTNDPAHRHIQTVLHEHGQYLEGLKSVGDIKEIHPSEHERQIERLRFNDVMREAFKEAEKESVLLHLVKRSVILYGNKSVTYVQGPEEGRRPVEMELKSHSTEFEIPRMEIVDPIGLDYMLRVFRVERLKS